jgi:enoyl-CoA hydratase
MADNKEGYSAAGSGVQRFGEDGFEVILVDEPVEGIRRITLNRPDKRNALNHALRGEVLHALQQGDMDERVKVQIIRGAGSCFSAGYDLGGGNEGMGYPFYTAGGDGQWPRHVTEGWMGIWDMAKPVIAQVHGYCLAGGSELARPDGLSGGAFRRARYAVPPLAGGHAQGHGNVVDGRFPVWERMCRARLGH